MELSDLNRHFKEDEWFVGIVSRPVAEIEEVDFFKGIEIIPNPKLHFTADPSIISEEPLRLLVESYSYTNRKGFIEQIERNSKASYTRNLVLEEPHHLSFPSLIRFKEVPWLLCESIESGEVYLVNTLTQEKRVILNRPLLDPEIIELAESYFLMGNNPESEALELYQSEKPLELYKECKNWTFEGDSMNDRAAGKVFEFKGTTCRPTQVHKNSEYGFGISFNQFEIDQENKRVSQSLILKIEPNRIALKGVKGIHTISSKGAFTVIDFKLQKDLKLNPLYKLKAKIGL